MLTIRDIQEKDVDFIADYWQSAEPEFLKMIGVDPLKLPTREARRSRILSEMRLIDKDKKAWWVIGELNFLPFAYSVLDPIQYGKEAEIHIQVCNAAVRRKGFGTLFFKKAVNYFFEKFQLKKIIIQPLSTNYPINRALQKMGLKISKTYRVVASSITGEEEVNRYEILTPFELDN